MKYEPIELGNKVKVARNEDKSISKALFNDLVDKVC